MIIYNYCPVTGIYLNCSNADKSPLDDAWLIPAHATTKKPPVFNDGSMAFFDTKSQDWKSILDNRGTVYFDDLGNRYEISEVGIDIPDNATLIPPPGKDYSLIDGNWIKNPITDTDVRIEAQRRVDLFNLKYQDFEIKTWNDQLNDAHAVIDNSCSDEYNIVCILSEIQGIDKEELAKSIVEKNKLYKKFQQHILCCQAVLLSLDPIPSDYQDDKYW